LIDYWTNEFGPSASGDYAGKAYWVATENWPNQNYPVHVTDPGGLYEDIGASGFFIGGTPTYVIIGFKNRVYYDSSGGPYYDGTNFWKAMRDAIDSFPTQNLYIDSPIADRLYNIGNTEQIDLSNVFATLDLSGPITKSVELVTDPSVLSATINGDILTLTASSYNIGVVTVQIRGTDPLGVYDIDEFQVAVTNPADGTIEDFNDGSLNAPPYTWTLTRSSTQAKNFSLVTTSPYEGAYCAYSGSNLNKHLIWCAMSTTVNYTAPGIIKFYKKVSSEANFDFLTLYIDGNSVGQWSGEVAWSQSSFVINTTGNHTFKFEYSKDEATQAGSDCAWVDYIEFIPNVTFVTPPTPTLVSPLNGSSAANQTPTFNWNTVTGATSYDLLVDNNSDFSSPEISVVPTTNSYTVPSKALSAGTYYWKVKVTSASGSYSSTWTYTVTSGTVIPAVPANITTSIVSGNVYVNWDNSADATSYDVYSSATPYGTFALLTNVTTSEYTYTPTATRMFFYIVAKNSTKKSPKTISVPSKE